MNNNPPNTNYGVGSGVPGAMHGSPSMLGSQGVGGGSGDKYSGNFSAARNLLTIYPSDKAYQPMV